jgi:hypothetical protein
MFAEHGCAPAYQSEICGQENSIMDFTEKPRDKKVLPMVFLF